MNKKNPGQCHVITNNGFTIVEVSIVILVIAFLIGGIMVGRDLLRAAETRKYISEMQKYDVAWHTFKLKYSCLPGDCMDASSLFSGAVNGNGNGVVNVWWEWGTVESLQSWNQLSSAGLIDGKYTSPAGGKIIDIGVTNPSSKINENIGYSIYADIVIGGGARVDYTYSLQIATLGNTIAWHDFLWGAGLNATVAYDIDNKIDDGVPAKGRFTGTNAEASPTNPYTICLSGGNYKIDTLNTGCRLYYEMAK